MEGIGFFESLFSLLVEVLDIFACGFLGSDHGFDKATEPAAWAFFEVVQTFLILSGLDHLIDVLVIDITNGDAITEGEVAVGFEEEFISFKDFGFIRAKFRGFKLGIESDTLDIRFWELDMRFLGSAITDIDKFLG